MNDSKKKACNVYLHVCFLITFHSLTLLVGSITKNAVCRPNYISSRVIRSSPCWLSTLYDNRAIHRLTNIDDLSGREMCFGAEEEAGWVISKPPKSPWEDRRSFADVIFIPNHPNYRTIIVCLLARGDTEWGMDLLKHSFLFTLLISLFISYSAPSNNQSYSYWRTAQLI